MFVDSLVRLLGDQTDLVVVDVANSVAEAIRAVERQDPDVVLLDYRLPDGDAPACIAALNRLPSNARVLVMTGLGDEATLAAARAAGCAGVVTKDRAARDLLEALRAVGSGASLTEPAPRFSPRRQQSPTGSLLSARARSACLARCGSVDRKHRRRAAHQSGDRAQSRATDPVQTRRPIASRSGCRRDPGRHHRPTRAPGPQVVVVTSAAR